MRNIVIAGNGAAGNSAAEAIRRHNQEVKIVMVAKEKLSAYSACALPDYLSGWVGREQLFIKQEADYARQSIETLWGRTINKIDTQQQCLVTDWEEVKYDQLILATGSRAIIPPVPGSDLVGNFVVKTLNDIEVIIQHQPQQVLVIGSGNIGIEVAEALHGIGCQVTVVELMDHIFPRLFDPEPASLIEKMLTEHGIRVFTGEKVLAISGKSIVQEAATDQRTIRCNTVIWAVGVKQNIEYAKAAGIKIGDMGGIQVNNRMRTNIENIYACGDCVESWDRLTGSKTLSLLWPNAKKQGEIAALNCLGNDIEYDGAISMVVEDIFGVTAVSMGMTSKDLGEGDIDILEEQGLNQFRRVLLRNDQIMGMQAVGVTSGLGAVMALMINRTTLSEFHHIISDPDLRRKVPWYWPAARLLDDFTNCRQGE